MELRSATTYSSFNDTVVYDSGSERKALDAFQKQEPGWMSQVDYLPAPAKSALRDFFKAGAGSNPYNGLMQKLPPLNVGQVPEGYHILFKPRNTKLSPIVFTVRPYGWPGERKSFSLIAIPETKKDEDEWTKIFQTLGEFLHQSPHRRPESTGRFGFRLSKTVEQFGLIRYGSPPSWLKKEWEVKSISDFLAKMMHGRLDIDDRNKPFVYFMGLAMFATDDHRDAHTLANQQDFSRFKFYADNSNFMYGDPMRGDPLGTKYGITQHPFNIIYGYLATVVQKYYPIIHARAFD